MGIITNLIIPQSRYWGVICSFETEPENSYRTSQGHITSDWRQDLKSDVTHPKAQS